MDICLTAVEKDAWSFFFLLTLFPWSEACEPAMQVQAEEQFALLLQMYIHVLTTAAKRREVCPVAGLDLVSLLLFAVLPAVAVAAVLAVVAAALVAVVLPAVAVERAAVAAVLVVDAVALAAPAATVVAAVVLVAAAVALAAVAVLLAAALFAVAAVLAVVAVLQSAVAVVQVAVAVLLVAAASAVVVPAAALALAAAAVHGAAEDVACEDAAAVLAAKAVDLWAVVEVGELAGSEEDVKSLTLSVERMSAQQPQVWKAEEQQAERR